MWSKLLPLLMISSHVLAGGVGVTLTITASSSTSTTKQCMTQKTYKPYGGNVPTITKTQTLPDNTVFIYSVSTPVSTVTRPPSTVTTTSTVTSTVTTTQMGLTSTFTSTRRLRSTTTFTSTVSSTVTITDTSFETSMATTTVAAPSGFRGIEETADDTDYAGAKRDLPVVKWQQARPPQKLVRKDSPDSYAQDYKYSKSVTCVRFIRVTYYVKIVAVKPTSTKTVQGSTSTISSIETTTSTYTVAPNVSSTITLTSYTKTISTTTTFTSLATETTSTTITTVSTSTVYAACAPTNILGPHLSRGDYTFSPVFNNPTGAVLNSFDDARNPYDCCAVCQSMASPGMGCLFTQFIGSIPECNVYFDITGVCSVNTNAGYFQRTSFKGEFDDVYSNGPCGYITEGPQI